MRAHWMKSQKESMRLEEAGLGGDVLDSALAAFILEVSNWQLLGTMIYVCPNNCSTNPVRCSIYTFNLIDLEGNRRFFVK